MLYHLQLPIGLAKKFVWIFCTMIWKTQMKFLVNSIWCPPTILLKDNLSNNTLAFFFFISSQVAFRCVRFLAHYIPPCACTHAQLCQTLCLPGLQPIRLPCPWDFSSKNTEVGCHLLQGIFPTQGSNPCLSCLSCIGRWILYHWATWEAPTLPLKKKYCRNYFSPILQMRKLRLRDTRIFILLMVEVILKSIPFYPNAILCSFLLLPLCIKLLGEL